MSVKRIMLGAVAATACILSASAALAGSARAVLEEVEPVGDEEIARFARADDKVEEIAVKWSRRFRHAESDSDLSAFKAEAEAEVAAAIEQEGLTVDRYNDIYMQAALDDELAHRIAESD
ncbi:MAG: DUF4168 domain-containing protein [Pseudomonadota bacterium]|nr:DUF4168 domain-containing protein [Pseudomonadota bacterium]